MSGTSLDGLDMAYCHIWENDGKWNFSIKNTAEIDYSDEMREYLKNAIHLSEEDHGQLHKDYGIWLGQQSKLFIDELDEEVDAEDADESSSGVQSRPELSLHLRWRHVHHDLDGAQIVGLSIGVAQHFCCDLWK